MSNDAMHAPFQNKEKEKRKKKSKHADRRRQSRRAEPVEAGSQESQGIIKKDENSATPNGNVFGPARRREPNGSVRKGRDGGNIDPN